MIALILIGLTLGLLSATFLESVGHKIFGHPSALQLKIYFRYPRFFAAFLRAYYHHFVIHHQKTYQVDILTQFKNEEDRTKVDDWILREFPIDFANLIWKEQYNLTLIGIAGILPFAIPFLVGPLIVALIFGPIAFFSSLVSAFIPILMSKFIHPVIHNPAAIDRAPRWVQIISRTHYMQDIFRNHYLHHKHEDSNYNLLLGGDHFWGACRTPSLEESIELERLMSTFKKGLGV